MGNGKQLITGSGNILIVDDDPINRRVMCEILKKLGYMPTEASDGASCLKIYPEIQSDLSLLILDVIMPGMACTEIISELKKQEPPPILLMSGVPLEGELEYLVDDQHIFYVQKPVNIVSLSELMHRLISLKYC